MNAQALFVAPPMPADITAAGPTHPLGVVGRRRILHAFLVQTLGYTSDGALDELEDFERSVSDAMLDRIDNHLRATTPLPAAQARPVRPAVIKLSNAKPGTELSIVRISDIAPAMLAYLSQLGLAAETRLTVRKHRANSAVMTIQIRGQAQEIHLGSVASDALWVQGAAAA